MCLVAIVLWLVRGSKMKMLWFAEVRSRGSRAGLARSASGNAPVLRHQDSRTPHRLPTSCTATSATWLINQLHQRNPPTRTSVTSPHLASSSNVPHHRPRRASPPRPHTPNNPHSRHYRKTQTLLPQILHRSRSACCRHRLLLHHQRGVCGRAPHL